MLPTLEKEIYVKYKMPPSNTSCTKKFLVVRECSKKGMQTWAKLK
jgi:hypothetical protein